MAKKIIKSIGILADPSQTFRFKSKYKILQVKYNELPEEIKHEKQSFLDFLGGNFQEISTLAHELSFLASVSVILYIDRNLFISEGSRISPYEVTHPKIIVKPLDFHKWLDGKDALIISLTMEKLRDFISLYHRKMVQIDKPCVISTGRAMINELTMRFPGTFIFVQRKGVARFGVENRQEILNTIMAISQKNSVQLKK